MLACGEGARAHRLLLDDRPSLCAGWRESTQAGKTENQRSPAGKLRMGADSTSRCCLEGVRLHLPARNLMGLCAAARGIRREFATAGMQQPLAIFPPLTGGASVHLQ